eukprot:Nk52_evm77s164 gene=Nk52_evmTU77s164
MEDHLLGKASFPFPISHLPSPCATLRLDIARQNCQQMQAAVQSINQHRKKKNKKKKWGRLTLRPHIKTLKTLYTANLATTAAPARRLGNEEEEEEANHFGGVVCSTVKEAVCLHNPGDEEEEEKDGLLPKKRIINDILYAVPITEDKVPVLFSTQLGRSPAMRWFGVCVDHLQQAIMLCNWLKANPHEGQGDLSTPVRVIIMMSCGTYFVGGCGSPQEALVIAEYLIEHLDPNQAQFGGIYVHPPHAYFPDPGEGEGETDVNPLVRVAREERDVALETATVLRASPIVSNYLTPGVEEGEDSMMVAIGSTPSMCAALWGSSSSSSLICLDGITEIHPGNYMALDTMQIGLADAFIGCAQPDYPFKLPRESPLTSSQSNQLLQQRNITDAQDQDEEYFKRVDAYCAVRILTRVISCYPPADTPSPQPGSANRALIDLGWCGISAQHGITGGVVGAGGGVDDTKMRQVGSLAGPPGQPRGLRHYGTCVSHPQVRIESLKQEAGMVSFSSGCAGTPPVPGTLLHIVPWHACSAANQHQWLWLVDYKCSDGTEKSKELVVIGVLERCRGW